MTQFMVLKRMDITQPQTLTLAGIVEGDDHQDALDNYTGTINAEDSFGQYVIAECAAVKEYAVKPKVDISEQEITDPTQGYGPSA